MIPSASNNPRSVWLGLALACSLALTGWRASLALTTDAPTKPVAGASPVELRLSSLIETMVGAGNVQVHRSERPDGSQSFLILLNATEAASAPGDEALLSLVSSAVFIDTLAGDTVTIDRLTFAQGRFGTLSPSQMLELSALAAICILIAGGLLAPVPMSTPARQFTETQSSQQAERRSPDVAVNPIAQRISEDPARAARIIRRWLGTPAVDR